MKYIQRNIEDLILKFTADFPVLALTGPRQSGKSTTLKKLFKDDYQYVTFDDFRNVTLFKSDPILFFETRNNYVIFDEAQKVPEIFNMIKIENSF
jgi:predicted AAA+ superfamily ATPase